VLQRVAMCVAVCVALCVAVCCSVKIVSNSSAGRGLAPVCCSALQCVSVCCNVCCNVCCSVLQCNDRL